MNSVKGTSKALSPIEEAPSSRSYRSVRTAARTLSGYGRTIAAMRIAPGPLGKRGPEALCAVPKSLHQAPFFSFSAAVLRQKKIVSLGKFQQTLEYDCIILVSIVG